MRDSESNFAARTGRYDGRDVGWNCKCKKKQLNKRLLNWDTVGFCFVFFIAVYMVYSIQWWHVFDFYWLTEAVAKPLRTLKCCLLIIGSGPRSAHGGGQEQAQGAGPALHEPGWYHRHRLRQRALPPPGTRPADPNTQQESCRRNRQAGASRAAPARPNKYSWAGSLWRSGPHGNCHITS